MAVVKVVGRADDFELVLKQNAKGLWEAAVPFDSDGMYILDLLAVDEAGNESRFAKALFTVDTANIHCKFNLQMISLDNKTLKTDIKKDLSQYKIALRRCDCVI